MEITKVQIHVLKNPNRNILGYADIIFDNVFVVRNIVIRENKEGYLYITMPCQISNNVRRDIAHPINEDFRIYTEDIVLNEYETVLDKIESARASHQVTPT